MKQINTKYRLFWIGLAFSLLGTGLIHLGDGSEHLFRKGVVVSGAILVVGGIAILRYLLFARKSKHSA